VCADGDVLSGERVVAAAALCTIYTPVLVTQDGPSGGGVAAAAPSPKAQLSASDTSFKFSLDSNSDAPSLTLADVLKATVPAQDVLSGKKVMAVAVSIIDTTARDAQDVPSGGGKWWQLPPASS
jgi:hypothetical protein